jgi:serine/threonine protein kinase
MFRKQDFKKVDLLGAGKKNTKIYKALHIPTNRYYALKEVEAKTLDKLNEYKVRMDVVISMLSGRSSAAIQGLAPPKCDPVFRLFLL